MSALGLLGVNGLKHTSPKANSSSFKHDSSSDTSSSNNEACDHDHGNAKDSEAVSDDRLKDIFHVSKFGYGIFVLINIQ